MTCSQCGKTHNRIEEMLLETTGMEKGHEEMEKIKIWAHNFTMAIREDIEARMK